MSIKSAPKRNLIKFPTRFRHVWGYHFGTLILGMPVSTLPSLHQGLGLIYMTCTGFKVPVYLGSSAAITAMALAMKWEENRCSPNWVILTGLIVLVAAGVKVAGTRWIDKLLPAVVIGPMIIVGGLGLLRIVKNAGFEGGDWKNALVAVVTS